MSAAISVSVTDEAIVFGKEPFSYIFLPGSLTFTFAGSDYFSRAVTF